MKKRWRVIVEFAHGIRHTLEFDHANYNRFEKWLLNEQEDANTIGWFIYDGAVFFLNRDYICCVIVEELHENSLERVETTQ
jgi:hypothetical protein